MKSRPRSRKSTSPSPGLLRLNDEHRLPVIVESERAAGFGTVRFGWNDGGIGIAVEVAGKKQPPVCDAHLPTEGDGLQVWIDTRNTQSIHRAGRFCHHFCVMPLGHGKNRDKPFGIQLPIARAKEEASLAVAAEIPVAMEVTADGYRLEAWLSAEILHGFDAEANPRIGFYYCLKDRELGEQFLTVGSEFPFAHDPSLWSTLELVR